MNGKINIDNLFKAAFEDFESQPSSEMLNNILGETFDTSLQSSFEDFTLAPATHIWENISDSIPIEGDKLLSASFDEFEAKPPAHLWANISESIPSEADKLFCASFNEFEEMPSAQVWENINEAIPSEIDQLLASSFDELEVMPSLGIWASIQGELDVEEHFDAKFQEAFVGFEPKPSEHILNNLLSNKFDTGVRRAFMRHETEPREVVWDKIKPYIKFGPVIQRHIPTIRRIAAVVVCLLMFTFLYDQFNHSGLEIVINQPTTPNQPNSINQPIPTQNNIQSSDNILENTTAERIVSAEQQPTNREAAEENVEIDQQIDQKFISQSSLSSKESSQFPLNGSSQPPTPTTKNEAILLSPTFTAATPIENESAEELISSIPNINISGLETYTPNIIISNPDLSDFGLLEVATAAQGRGSEYAASTSNLVNMDEDSDLTRMMLNYRGLYVSASHARYISRILNDDVREGLSDQSPVDYAVDLGRSFGLGAGYQFTPNFGIEAEVLSSRLSQSYRELTDLSAYNPSNARTNYLYIPLSFKYQTRRLNSMNKRVPMTLSVVLGTHYGKLRSVDLTSNRDIDEGTEDRFIQQELGVFTGADYHLYISPNMHLTIGGRIAAGTDFEYLSAPFEPGTPYNLQGGVRVALNYRFATRQYKWDHGIY